MNWMAYGSLFFDICIAIITLSSLFYPNNLEQYLGSVNILLSIIVVLSITSAVLTKPNNKSSSLRTTVPKGVANQFELKEGDSVYWEIRPSSDGKDLIIVVSLSQEKSKKKM